MALRARFRDRIVIENLRDVSPTTNEYGDVKDAEDDLNWEAFETTGLIIPQGSDENQVDRETAVTTYALYVRPGEDLRSTSKVSWERAEGELVTANVVSLPIVHRSARGHDSHMVATLEVIDE